MDMVFFFTEPLDSQYNRDGILALWQAFLPRLQTNGNTITCFFSETALYSLPSLPSLIEEGLQSLQCRVFIHKDQFNAFFGPFPSFASESTWQSRPIIVKGLVAGDEFYRTYAALCCIPTARILKF